MDPRDELIQSLAKDACNRVLAKAVAGLKTYRAQLSGDDSSLRTAFDEFCVQVHEGGGLFADAYELTAMQHIEGELAQLAQHERQAIWLQTDPGWDWLWELNNPEEQGEKPAKVPSNDSDCAEYVYREYLLPFAENYSNASIDEYLEQAQRTRFDMDRGA